MSTSDVVYYMARALVLTVFIETLIAFIIGYRKKDLLNVILVNIMTNPIVFILPVYIRVKYGHVQGNVVLLILEIITICIEGIVYYKYFSRKIVNPFILSLILNVSSFLLGIIINSI